MTENDRVSDRASNRVNDLEGGIEDNSTKEVTALGDCRLSVYLVRRSAAKRYS